MATAEQAVGLLSVYTAQPTIRVNGNVVDEARTLLISMEMHEQETGMSRLELRFTNVLPDSNGGATLAFENNTFDFGKEVAVYTGDENVPVEIFRGPITGIEAAFPEFAPPEFVVLAEDALRKAHFTRKTKFFDNLSVRDLLDQIGLKTGLTAGNGPGTNAGPQMQMNESLLAFLRRIMARFDLDAQAVGPDLQCAERQNVRRNQVTLEMHSQLRQARVVADLADQVTEITVSGWNPKQGQKVSASSSGRNLGPGQGRPGRQAFDNAFGARSEHIGHLAVATSDEARTLADAAFDQRARGFVTLHGVAEGNPQIRAGSHVTVNGLGRRFDNTYYVKRALHRYDLEEGYKTEFVGECAFVGVI